MYNNDDVFLAIMTIIISASLGLIFGTTIILISNEKKNAIQNTEQKRQNKEEVATPSSSLYPFFYNPAQNLLLDK